MTVTTEPLHLHGRTVPADRLRRIALSCGGTAETEEASETDADDGARHMLIVADPTQQDLLDGLTAPYAGCIEVDADDALTAAQIAAGAGTDLAVSLTTLTANRLPVAQAVVQAIAHRRPLEGEARQNIELAVHEAVTNALIHGNLRVDTIAEMTAEALADFSQRIAARLADPIYARRRIGILIAFVDEDIVVEVTDEGDGYAPALRRQPSTAFGRGIDLIQAVSAQTDVLDGGWRIRMRFAS